MKKQNVQKNLLEKVYEDLDQYDHFEQEIMEVKEEKYSILIGKFLIWFSNLEHTLDILIANHISDRAHQMGYIVIKDLEMLEKIELFNNLIFPLVFDHTKRKIQKINQLSQIKKKLEDLSTLRNKIAHAKWFSLDKDGFVRVDAKCDKVDGNIKFRKFKITPIIIINGIQQIKSLIIKIGIFEEKINT